MTNVEKILTSIKEIKKPWKEVKETLSAERKTDVPELLTKLMEQVKNQTDSFVEFQTELSKSIDSLIAPKEIKEAAKEQVRTIEEKDYTEDFVEVKTTLSKIMDCVNKLSVDSNEISEKESDVVREAAVDLPVEDKKVVEPQEPKEEVKSVSPEIEKPIQEVVKPRDVELSETKNFISPIEQTNINVSESHVNNEERAVENSQEVVNATTENNQSILNEILSEVKNYSVYNKTSSVENNTAIAQPTIITNYNNYGATYSEKDIPATE